MITTSEAFQIAKRLGTWRAIYEAAADSAHPEHGSAVEVLDLCKMDSQGISNGYGARAAVQAAVLGEPYAVATHGVTEYVFG